MQIFNFILLSFNFIIYPPDSTIAFDSSFDIKKEIISVSHYITKEKMNFVYNTEIYQLGCDTVPNVKFWRNIMKLHKDSALFNTPANRNVLSKEHIQNWERKDLASKSCYKDSLRNWYCLDDSARILLTNGKSFFYDFEKASANFNQGINDFIANDVDPWYAQAILMIESPNKLQKSNVGAYGSFQLMKDVARLFGLKVNNNVDERANFDRSAYAASSLIKKICIPLTKQILDSLGIRNYKENELWFRLLVMHSYHAGAGNVKKALFSFRPTVGNINLIYTLWHIETKKFKSASQNYSQLILAAMLEVNEKFNLAPKQLDVQNNYKKIEIR